MTTRISLVCHAATTATRASDFPLDEPLDPHGLRKLSNVSERFDPAIEAWTSPARRAVQTAQALGMRAALDPSLRDWDYGRWRGRSLDDIQSEDPGGVLRWLRDPGAAPHGGEALLDVLERGSAWLDARKQKAGRVVAVTHAAVIRAMVVTAIEASPASFWRIDIAPLSITRLTCSHGAWTLASIGPMATT